MNKTFRKILSGALACMLAASAAVPMCALADEIEPQSVETPRMYEARDYTFTDYDVAVDAEFDGTQDEKLHGTDADSIEAEIIRDVSHESTPKIYVEVEWDELKFVYDFGTVVDYDWNLDSLRYDPVYEYDNGKEVGWDKEYVEFRFTNYSNRNVWTFVDFDLNEEAGIYDDVKLTPDYDEIELESAVGKDGNIETQAIKLYISGEPEKTQDYDFKSLPSLGAARFAISEYRKGTEVPETPATPEQPSGEHEHHYVYDQFGRLVCTGCNNIKHEYCVDFDEDGLCDECGLERDFCEDCHVGGKCLCT